MKVRKKSIELGRNFMAERLTNACFAGHFESLFDLAEYAIALARFRIRSEGSTTLSSVFDEVRRHPNPHYLEAISAVEDEPEEDELS